MSAIGAALITYHFSLITSTVRLRRGAENAEPAEVEVEQIRRGVDAAQRTLEFEVVALVLLDEAAREYYLEHVTTQTVLDTLADVCPVLVIGLR